MNKKEVTYRDLSKRHTKIIYKDSIYEYSEVENIITNGCLMRIADSLEKKESEYSKIISSMNEMLARYERKNTSLRARLTLCEKRLSLLESNQ